jgi:hypothetical protein
MAANKRLSSLLSQLATSQVLSSADCSSNASGVTLEMRTMANERAKATFDVEKLTFLLDGNEKYTKYKVGSNAVSNKRKKNKFTSSSFQQRTAAQIIERDAILNDGYVRYDLSRPEARERFSTQN